MLVKLITFALQQRVFVLAGALVVLIAGWNAIGNLPVEAFPDVQDVQAAATINRVFPGPSSAVSWIVASTTGSDGGCADPILGGTGAFSFQAVQIVIPLTGLLPGHLYQISVPVAYRTHGSTGPFTPSGSVVGTFTPLSSSYMAHVDLGWPFGWNMDATPACPSTGAYVLTRLS